MTTTILSFRVDGQLPDITRTAIADQLALVAALTRQQTAEPIELDEAAARGLSDLMQGAANALNDLGEVESERMQRDAAARQVGVRHLRRLGLAPVEPMDLHDVIAAFGEWVDSLPEQPAPIAPRLTEPAPPAARRRAS